MPLTSPRTPTVDLCLRVFNNPAETIWCNCGTLTHARIQTVPPSIRIIFAWNCSYARHAYGQYAHFGAKWECLDTYATHVLLRLPRTYRHAHAFHLPWCQHCLLLLDNIPRLSCLPQAPWCSRTAQVSARALSPRQHSHCALMQLLPNPTKSNIKWQFDTLAQPIPCLRLLSRGLALTLVP